MTRVVLVCVPTFKNDNANLTVTKGREGPNDSLCTSIVVLLFIYGLWILAAHVLGHLAQELLLLLGRNCCGWRKPRGRIDWYPEG